MRFVRSEASERSKKIEANTMPSMPYMALAYYMCWLFLMMKKRTWRTMQHTIPAAAAAAAASTSTTLAILCIKAYFSHTRVSHIFTCLQSSRISRLSPLEFPHSWRKQVLLLLSLLLLEPCIFFASLQLDAMCNKMYLPSEYSIPPLSPLRQIHLHC